jgi:uroporphyrinogen decarboxylase-like protein
MSMSLRERILAVYRGETPDVIPYMLDLSHWFYHRNQLPWDLSQAQDAPEHDLVAYHKKVGAGFYCPNLAAFFTTSFTGDIQARVTKSPDGREITWEYETALGTIRRKRIWEEQTYAWGIAEWAITTEEDLRILGQALNARTYSPNWGLFDAWTDCVGDQGVVYMSFGYSAMGHMLNYWLGIQGTVYATVDWPTTLREVIDQANANGLQAIDLLAQSPADIIIMGDNFSSDIQPAYFFDEWSKPFYEEAIRRLHAAGKYVAVHIDGKLRGALEMFREAGADCADAVTPVPMGDLEPEQCRAEAGNDLILSGGVSPDLWLPHVPLDTFKQAVLRWIALKQRSPRLIANAGDQVPPNAEEQRIHLMRDLVEEHGQY